MSLSRTYVTELLKIIDEDVQGLASLLKAYCDSENQTMVVRYEGWTALSRQIVACITTCLSIEKQILRVVQEVNSASGFGDRWYSQDVFNLMSRMVPTANSLIQDALESRHRDRMRLLVPENIERLQISKDNAISKAMYKLHDMYEFLGRRQFGLKTLTFDVSKIPPPPPLSGPPKPPPSTTEDDDDVTALSETSTALKNPWSHKSILKILEDSNIPPETVERWYFVSRARAGADVQGGKKTTWFPPPKSLMQACISLNQQMTYPVSRTYVENAAQSSRDSKQFSDKVDEYKQIWMKMWSYSPDQEIPPYYNLRLRDSYGKLTPPQPFMLFECLDDETLMDIIMLVRVNVQDDDKGARIVCIVPRMSGQKMQCALCDKQILS